MREKMGLGFVTVFLMPCNVPLRIWKLVLPLLWSMEAAGPQGSRPSTLGCGEAP